MKNTTYYLPLTSAWPPAWVWKTGRSQGRKLVLLLALVLSSLAAGAQSAGMSFTFTLPHAYTTSAGVYASDGHRVRLLWKKATYDAGPHTAQWDGKDDAGAAVPATTYTVKVLYHNMTYTWEGVIGNTSATFTGYDQTWHLNSPLPDMAITPDGTTAYTANGYTEGKPSSSRFATTNPQVPTAVVYDVPSNGHANNPLQLTYVATDGTRTYYAQVGNGWKWVSFVLAVGVTGADRDKEVKFSSGGQSYQLWEHLYQSVIDKTDPDANGKPVSPPTGLAVQTNGLLLAVAHGGANEVRLFDKTSGAPRGTIPFTDPGRLAFAPNGDLWIISGSGRLAERRSYVGSTNNLEASITGLVRPLGIAVNPTNSQVLVSDGGSSQQIKCYSPAGALQWTLGEPGGYATNPTVTPTKFYLDAPVSYGNVAPGKAVGYVATAPDGSFWVGDAGNMRNLHFAADRTYLGQIAYMTLAHNCTVDVNNATRIFSEELLEYQVDYSKPLRPGDPDPARGGNGSWKLVRNWAAGAPANYSRDLTSVATLPNGRTYGLVYNPQDQAPHNPYSRNWSVVELPATGPLRDTGVRLDHQYDPDDSGTHGFIYPNGDLRYRDNPSNGPTQSFYRQALSGFDGSNNPQWGPPELLATAAARPVAYKTYPITSSGVLVAYYPYGASDAIPFGDARAIRYDDGSLRYHLGGVPLNSSVGMAWVDMKPIDNDGIPSGNDHTPPDGLGGVGQRAFGGLTGTNAFASGQHILAYYNGQGNKMSNQWSDWWDDGLFVGQFGEPDNNHYYALAPRQTERASLDAPPGSTYNATRPAVVEYNGTTYAFLADESYHSGIHRWRLAGQVRELVGSGSLGSTVALGTAGAWPTDNLVFNPSFEADELTLTPSGWAKAEGTGSAGASTSATGNDAPSFPYFGRQAKDAAYTTATYQRLTNLPNGTYRLRAQVRSSGGQQQAVLYARTASFDTGGAYDYSVAIPAASAWAPVELAAVEVRNGQCELGFFSNAGAGQWLEFDDVDLRPAAAPTSPAGLVSGGTYLLLARHSGKALDVFGSSTASQAQVGQWTRNGNPNQQWVVERQSDGFFTLTHQGTNQHLEVKDNAGTDGTVVWQNQATTSDAQRWLITPTDNGYYKLLHKGTSKCLDVTGGPSATDNGPLVHQWEYLNGLNQQWRFELLAAPASARVALATAVVGDPAALNVYPNPAADQLHVQVTVSPGPAVLTLLDPLGRLVRTQELATGVTQAALDVRRLPAGLYLLRLQQGSQTYTRKVVLK